MSSRELFKELGRHACGVGHRKILIAGLARSHSSMFFFLNVQRMVPRESFCQCLKKVIPIDSLKDFFIAALLNSVGDYIVSVWDRRNEI